MGERLKAVILQWRQRWQNRRRDEQEREDTARQNTRDYYPARKDVSGGPPQIGL